MGSFEHRLLEMACETCLWERFWLAWSSVLIYTFTRKYYFSLSRCLRLDPIFLSLGNAASLFVTSKRHKRYPLDSSWWLLFCSWIICPLFGDHLSLTTTACMGLTAPALTCTLEALWSSKGGLISCRIYEYFILSSYGLFNAHVCWSIFST